MTDIEIAIRFFNGWKNMNEKTRKTLPQNTVAYNAYTKEIEYLELAIKALKQMEGGTECEALEQKQKTDTWSIKDVADTLAKHGLIAEQETCEDAVSRQAVIELCEGWWLGHTKEDDFATEIRALPSVNPQEPKTGHWIKTPIDVMGDGYMWYCNKCEHKVYQDSSRPYPSENYCPNCGAKMSEIQTGSESEE